MASLVTPAPAPVNDREMDDGRAGNAERWVMGNTVYVNAPVEKVREEMVDFEDMKRWHPRVLSSTLISGEARTPGAVRCVHTTTGHTFYEMLTRLDAEEHAMEYSMLDNTFGMVDYHAQIILRVGDTPDSTAVAWSSLMGPNPLWSRTKFSTFWAEA